MDDTCHSLQDVEVKVGVTRDGAVQTRLEKWGPLLLQDARWATTVILTNSGNPRKHHLTKTQTAEKLHLERPEFYIHSHLCHTYVSYKSVMKGPAIQLKKSFFKLGSSFFLVKIWHTLNQKYKIHHTIHSQGNVGKVSIVWGTQQKLGPQGLYVTNYRPSFPMKVLQTLEWIFYFALFRAILWL